MNASVSNRKNLLVSALTLAALGVLAAVYFSPIWWVALTAPNYPEEAFPDGVRIQFHMNGVFNGCRKIEKKEIQEDQALDCVHEMDTINHYVGMYPIAAGAPVERSFSPFLMVLLGVMLVGFAIPNRHVRAAVMALGCAGIAGWMWMTFKSDDGLALQSRGYVEAMVTALDQEAGAEEEVEELSAGQALIALLRAELEKSGVEVEGAREETEAEATEKSDKERLLESLRVTFEKDQERRGTGIEWSGRGEQMLLWHYEKTLGRYFNDPAQIKPMVGTLSVAYQAVFWGLLGAMLLLVAGAWRWPLFYWLLVGVPILLPVFFLVDYSAWLWWFGHNLNEMGAFTVKPFMPTVFGQGKVAQFATHSYPDIGFGLMLLSSALLIAAALVRRVQMKQQGEA